MQIKLNKFIFVFSIFFLVLLIVFPDISKNGVVSGMLISTNVIIPSLFPFTVMILIIIKSGFTINNRFFNNLILKLFGQNFNMFFAFIISMIGGYPIGAKLINELYKEKCINKNTSEIMLLYCINAGPAFVISAIGSGVLNSQKLGIILFFAHIFPSILIAVFCKKSILKNNCENIHTISKNKKFSDIFVESVADASTTIISICSFIIIFSCINSILDYFFSDLPIIKYISYFTEVTSGVTKTKNIYFISFLLGFSGVSIWCQIFSIINNIKINFLKFFFGRIFHGILSLLVLKFIICILKIKISTFSNNINFSNEILYSKVSLSLSMLVMLIVFLVTIYSKNNCSKIIKDVV